MQSPAAYRPGILVRIARSTATYFPSRARPGTSASGAATSRRRKTTSQSRRRRSSPSTGRKENPSRRSSPLDNRLFTDKGRDLRRQATEPGPLGRRGHDGHIHPMPLRKAGLLRQIEGVAGHDRPLPAVQHPVTGRAGAHTAAHELFFPGQGRPGFGSGSEDQAFPLGHPRSPWRRQTNPPSAKSRSPVP